MSQDHRARRYAETHQRIHQAAMRLFGERGYEGVPIAHIAAAAGVSVQTFYAHYTGKDELIMALPDRAEVAALLASVPDDRPLGERMRGVIVCFVRGLEGARRSDALARWKLIAATPRLRCRAAEYERATAHMFLDALGLDEPDVDTVSSVVVTAHMSAYTQALLRWAESGGERSLEDIAAEVLAALRDHL
ncbi:TetR/AcrR family transcriptional regulator [Geodermatophilus sp. DF01-2]|uniref:TetR/AcrR family transcriptional regulator n=1 Tax=Geodermatophilus sp. DF01-2 TaxID=2559610 RepID=UPI0014301803|nr:TetR/AcrR family transcriptional regulator [Geodermatophilus sp. DF01_2]